MDNSSIDQNNIHTLLGVSSADGKTPVKIYADPTTHRLLVQIETVGASGSFTSDDGKTITVVNGVITTIV